MAKTNKVDSFCVTGDGHRFKIVSVVEGMNSDGIKTITFDLIPTEALKTKFKLVYPDDYDNLKLGTIRRQFFLIDEVPLGNARVDYDLIKLAEYITRFHHILKPLMGDKDFGEFKELIDKMNKQYKYLKGVMKITDDPQAPFKYFAFNDLNNNITAPSSMMSVFTSMVKNYQKELHSAEGKVAGALEKARVARTEILEHIKQNKQESETLGNQKVYDTQPSPEDRASQDQSFG